MSGGFDGWRGASTAAAGAATFPGYGGTPPNIGPNVGTAGVSPLAERSDARPGQNLVAQWTLGAANRRVYLVDGVNGVDDAAHAGFLDGGSANFPISGATIAATAKKTLGALLSIFPPYGAGRDVEIIIANGGVNTTGTYVDGLHSFMQGTYGYNYKSPLVRGTGTNTTAGATAFAGNAADLAYLGGVTCAGCNSAGYNVIGTPTNQVFQLQKAGGGAAAIPAEPAAPLMWRIRGASTNAQNANVYRAASIVAGTDTVTAATAFGTVPTVGNGDVYFLEQAGVSIAGGNFVGPPLVQTAGFQGMIVAGIIIGTGFNTSQVGLHFAFSGITGNPGAFDSQIFSQQTYQHSTGGTITCGGGLHVAGAWFQAGGRFDVKEFCTETITTVNECSFVNWKRGSVAGTGCYFSGAAGTDHSTVTSIGPADAESQLKCRVLGSASTPGAGIVLSNMRAVTGNVDVSGVGARPGVLLVNSQVFQAVNSRFTGTTGNTDVGVAFGTTTSNGTSTWNANGNTGNTLTGTGGDIRLFTPAGVAFTIAWAQANATGIADGRGSLIVGAGGGPVGILKFSGAIVSSAIGATVSYLADTGAQLIAANLGAQRYPTSLRLMTRLRVTKLVGAGVLTNNVTATLYKSGVATTMTVTILAADAAFTKYVDSAHPILFLDSDDFDLRLDNAADVLAGILLVSAGLEYAA